MNKKASKELVLGILAFMAVALALAFIIKLPNLENLGLGKSTQVIGSPAQQVAAPAAESPPEEQGQIQEVPYSEDNEAQLAGSQPRTAVAYASGSGGGSSGSSSGGSHSTASNIIDSHVNSNSFVSSDSKVIGSTIINSRIINSIIKYSLVDPSNVTNSTVLNSTVTDSIITNSFINFSNITNSNILNSNITNCTIENSTLNDVQLDNVKMVDNVIANEAKPDYFNSTSPYAGHYISFYMEGAKPDEYQTVGAVTILPTHTGPSDNCSETNCNYLYMDMGVFNFNITNGTTLLANMTLNGVFLASTASDKITLAGATFFWGNATITQIDPGFGYSGNYEVGMEAWNGVGWIGAFVVINKTGTGVNLTQFVVNMTKILSNNEIIIQSSPQIPVDLIENNKQYSMNITNFGLMNVYDSYETLVSAMSGKYVGLYNRTTTIGRFNITNSTRYWVVDGWGKGWYNSTNGKYYRIFYGYVLDEGNLSGNIINNTLDTCTDNSQCNDNDSNTFDVCYNSMDQPNVSIPTCSHFPYNIYGQITDSATGLPVAGANISFYPSSVFVPYTLGIAYYENGTIGSDTGDYSALQPKAVPDTVTDENGNYKYYLPYDAYTIVVQHSSKKKFDVTPGNVTGGEIILPEDGNVVVTFEKASAYLKSDLYFKNVSGAGNSFLLDQQSTIGVWKDIGTFNEGDELQFYITVNGTTWSPSLGYYNHTSISQYAIIERLDYDTWRIYFEDLPASITDWDFNDAVVLVDLTPSANTSNYTYEDDCDGDGIKNWDDENDSWCDKGSEDTDIFENQTNTSGYRDFNVEGHIIHEGKFTNDNNYTCGQNVEFVMFGENKGTEDVTVTFAVENHSGGGEPTDNRWACGNDTNPVTGRVDVDGIVYCGDRAWIVENLYIPVGAQGNDKVTKYYNFSVPCDFAPAFGEKTKYDIHVYDNLQWGNMHKIGNFFVYGFDRELLNQTNTTNTTNETNTTTQVTPGLGTLMLTTPNYILTYTNMSIDMWYHVKRIPAPGTIESIILNPTIIQLIGENMSWYYNGKDTNFNVTVTDITDPENPIILFANGVGSKYVYNPLNQIHFNTNFTQNGYKNISTTAVYMPTNQTVTGYTVVKVAITEEEADAIADPNYQRYFSFTIPEGDWRDQDQNVQGVQNIWDRYDTWVGGYNVGDEYCTNGNFNDSCINNSDAQYLQNELYEFCVFQPMTTQILPSTACEYNNSLNIFLDKIKCCGGFSGNGPLCGSYVPTNCT